jgi:hypothetical protein
MDYSLMVAVDEVISRYICVCILNVADNDQSRKELVVGIIDVVRTYTWVRKTKANLCVPAFNIL